jgi:hypothetical protein
MELAAQSTDDLFIAGFSDDELESMCLNLSTQCLPWMVNTLLPG